VLASNHELARAVEYFVDARFPKAKMAAVVAWDSSFSQNFYKTLSDGFRARSPLVRVFGNLSDIDRAVSEALQLQPSVLLLPNFPVVTSGLISAFTRAGFKGMFVGPDTWGEGVDPRYEKILRGIQFEGYTVRQFSVFRMSKEEKRLKETLTHRGAEKYPVQAALHYDAVRYLLSLIEEIGPTVDRKSILELSKKRRNFRGIAGFHCFSSRNCPERQFVYTHVQNSVFKYGGLIRPGIGISE
jgi:hypothetical protein